MTFVPISVSVRDQIVPVLTGETLFEVIRRIGVTRFEAVVDAEELLPHLRDREGIVPSIGDDLSVQKLRKRLKDEGAQISAFLLATDFSADKADRHVSWAVRVIRSASKLEIPVVRIDPWTRRHDLAPQSILENFIRRVSLILDETGDTAVDVAMENHGRLFNDPQILDHVLKAIPSPRFGLTLDTGNLYWWGHPISQVYELIERYSHRIKHTHIKNVGYPSAMRDVQRDIGFEYKKYCGTLYEGDLDLRRIVEILRHAGYWRDLCVEDESLFKAPEKDRVEILRQDVACLRNAQ
jgi:sugar phosphate isomerase/epimerase